MTTTETAVPTAERTCSCGCAPAVATDGLDTGAAASRATGCTCGTGDSSGCGPDCGCGSAG